MIKIHEFTSLDHTTLHSDSEHLPNYFPLFFMQKFCPNVADFSFCITKREIGLYKINEVLYTYKSCLKIPKA